MSQIPNKKTLAKAMLVFGGAQAFSVLAGLVRNKVAAVTIGATGVGLNALFLAVVGLIGNIVGLGLGNSAVQRLSELSDQPEAQAEEIGRLRTMEYLLSTISLLLAVLIAPWLSKYYFEGTRPVWEMILLGVIAGSYVISSIETAILKSLGRSKQLASYMLWVAILSVCFCVPLYYTMGIDGVIWSLTLCYLVPALLAISMGQKASPVKPHWTLVCHLSNLVRSSTPVIRLGLAFLVTSVVAQMVELFIQSMLQQLASLEELGLYKAGFQMSVTYPMMIFAAIANDYFPRLSAIANDVEKRNQLVRQQTIVLLAVVIPCIALYEVIVPRLVPLMLSDEFLVIVPMIRWASLSILFKALMLPMGYLPLALGKSKHFIILESVSWILLAICIFAGYYSLGFDGIGIGIVLSTIFDAIMYAWFVSRSYGFRIGSERRLSFSVIPIEGLGNRLRAIASAIEIARHYKVALTVYWNASDNCRCRYGDLFVYPSVTDVTWVENRSLLHSLSSWRHNLRLPRLLQRLNYRQRLIGYNYWPANDIYAELNTDGAVLLETCHSMTPTYFPLDEWLVLQPALQQRVEDVVLHFSSFTVGLHVRGTDHLLSRQHSTLEKFITHIDVLIAEDPQVNFFLATDETEVKRVLLERYPGRVLTQQIPLCRDTVDGMKAAIVDCFCLSRTRYILGSFNSSYSSLAAELGHIELKEVE